MSLYCNMFLGCLVILLNFSSFIHGSVVKNIGNTYEGGLKYMFSGKVNEQDRWPVSFGINLENIPNLNPRGMRKGSSTESHSCHKIRKVPKSLWKEINPSHYKLYTEAYGIPVVGSELVSADGLKRACYIVRLMLASRFDIRQAFYKNHGRVALIASSEDINSLPEYKWIKRDTQNTENLDKGFGATVDAPVSAAGDDNQRCCCSDRNPRQDILIHEFAHGVHMLAASYVVPGFNKRLYEAYIAAMRAGKWAGSYAATDWKEYWAVGVTLYFDSYHVGNLVFKGFKVEGKSSLLKYDPRLYNLIAEVFPCDNTVVPRCKRRRCTESTFEVVANAKRRLRSSCDIIFRRHRSTVSQCMDSTCFHMARGFAMTRSSCFILNCTSKDMMLHRVPSFLEPQTVYRLKKFPKKDHKQERSQVMNMNCLRAPSKTKCSPSSSKMLRIHLRDVNECERHGGCRKGKRCYYAKQDCLDLDKHCTDAAGTGECFRNFPFMILKCPVSCGACNTVRRFSSLSKVCFDENFDCKRWADAGECQKNPNYMFVRCPLSCRKCALKRLRMLLKGIDK